MQTFLPSPSYVQTAQWLDTVRLNSQINEALVIIRSLMHVYDIRKDGSYGFENHTVSQLWKGHELQLSRYALACAEEWAKRPRKGATNFVAIRNRIHFWRGMIDEFVELGVPDTTPSLVGDEEFHSAFRALLLHKEQERLTFDGYKHGEYEANFELPAQKRAWKPEFYALIWARYGRPDPIWYSQWGWEELPTDQRVFYTEDRVPQAKKEAKRKEEVPTSPIYRKTGRKRKG